MRAFSRAATSIEVLAGGHGIGAAFEAAFGPRPDFDARLRIILPVPLDETGTQRLQYHPGGFIEAFAQFIHGGTERGEFASRQAAAKSETHTAVAQQIEHRHLLRHTQRIVPRQDDGRGAEIGVRAQRREIRQ